MFSLLLYRSAKICKVDFQPVYIYVNNYTIKPYRVVIVVTNKIK